MREKILKGDPIYGYLEDILKATDRAAALTGQLLTFSRQQIVNPQVIDLNRLVLDLERMLQRLIEEDIELQIDTAPHLGTVKADPGYLNQIIMNLVINARDAMPGGGHIVVETAKADFEHQLANQIWPGAAGTLRNTPGDGQWQSVWLRRSRLTSSSRSLPPRNRARAPAWDSSMVYGIIKQSGGFIDLESVPVAGSTFTVYLPRLGAADGVSPGQGRLK